MGHDELDNARELRRTIYEPDERLSGKEKTGLVLAALAIAAGITIIIHHFLIA